MLHELWRLTFRINVEKGTTIPESLHLPRPDDAEAADDGHAEPEEMHTFFSR